MREELMGMSTRSHLKKELGENYRYYSYIQEVSESKGILARMPYEITVK
jgi:hypothetical protein